MRVVVGERLGGPEVLKVAERQAPRPGPGEVVVEVAAAGVNFMDIYVREGVGNYRTEPPFVLGVEGAGTVSAVGEDVTGLAVGDHVAWAGPSGSYAEEVVLPAKRVVPVPDGMSLQVAGAAMLQGMTAHYLVTSTYPVRDGVGAHGVYDGVGKDTFDDSLAALRPRGMMVLFGASSGQVPPVDPQRLNSGGSLFLTRPTLAHYIADPAELQWRAGEVLDQVASGELDVRIGGSYPLADAARAQQDLAARRTTGKLLLIP